LWRSTPENAAATVGAGLLRDIHHAPWERRTMLYWALVFLVVALVAALFGFGGIAAGAAGIAKILFFVFLVLFIVSLIAGGVRRPTI
jgi:uncharacterized membrane protein YtjA (UPF0391 family)